MTAAGLQVQRTQLMVCQLNKLSFTVQARDDSYAENAGTASAAFSATTTGSDSTPPSPNPLTATTDVSSSSVLITAATATDASPVEYRFVNTSGNADSSEWQTSNVYLVEGLSASTAYTYEVIARDLSSSTNTTTASIHRDNIGRCNGRKY